MPLTTLLTASRKEGSEGKEAAKGQMEEIKCEWGGNRARNTEEWANELNNELTTFEPQTKFPLLCVGGSTLTGLILRDNDPNNWPWLRFMMYPSTLFNRVHPYGSIHLLTVLANSKCRPDLYGNWVIAFQNKRCNSAMLVTTVLYHNSSFPHNPISFTADVSNADGKI